MKWYLVTLDGPGVKVERVALAEDADSAVIAAAGMNPPDYTTASVEAIDVSVRVEGCERS